MSSILSLLELRDRQPDAVTLRDQHVVVTAGAGSGKTRTLVGRYLALLEDGVPLRSLVAITFTEKAAREMRSRVRKFISEWLAQEAVTQRELWQNAFAELDSARIGTIHGLCAAILRAHPAEAGVDPAFEVLDENTSAALRAQSVETALAWAANDAEAAPLFLLLQENALREMLAALLVAPAWERVQSIQSWEDALTLALAAFADAPEVPDALDTLTALHASGALTRTAGDKLAAQVMELLAQWKRIAEARAERDWERALSLLFQMRRAYLSGKAGKAGTARNAVTTLREAYDARLDPWLGGQAASDEPPRWSLDLRAAELLPQLHRVLDAARRRYARLKEVRRALDFDDLEAQTDALLERDESVRARWQSELHAVMVDEFQDTNARQRRIIYALCGMSNAQIPKSRSQASLFIVGDAKQSIYRFRGADVTVFRLTQADLAARGGKALDFDLTYRAHEPLVAQLNALLEPILGAHDDLARPYAIPFTRLRAHRLAPRASIRAPFIELCIGLGEDAEMGRHASALMLATRLRRLREGEQVAWGQMALLFRAATHFPAYEAALEREAIPFVTVAGKGFYDRPEIRDLLNLLAAVADPTDDLALAGALRSPALGLSDAALYLLRWDEDARVPRSLWYALHADVSRLDADDAARTLRAREILRALTNLTGRVSAAAVLKTLLDETDYRTILRLAPNGERAQRNVDKLLADAHTSELTSLTEFLEYVRTLRDVSAREGEAPVEAGESVQLMTVHKAKGLEFDVVVIADASYASRGANAFLMDSRLGPLFPLHAEQTRSVMYRLAAQRDADQADAEDRRLLYVAATRAKEKLIVNGHAKRKSDGTLSLAGWLKRVGDVIGLNAIIVPEIIDMPLAMMVNPSFAEIGCTVAPLPPHSTSSPASAPQSGAEDIIPVSNIQLSHPPTPESTLMAVSSLLAPLCAPPGESADEKVRAHEAEPPPRVWRVVPTVQRPRGPAWVVGKLAHEALRRWRFPDRAEFEVFLYPHALAAGLTDKLEIAATINEARKLITRFQAHALFAEMDSAQRYHAVPYTLRQSERVVSGVIDVLYRLAEAAATPWRIIDFRTDEIRDERQLAEKVRDYRPQLLYNENAVRELLGVAAQGRLCFLDVRGEMRMVADGER